MTFDEVTAAGLLIQAMKRQEGNLARAKAMKSMDDLANWVYDGSRFDDDVAAKIIGFARAALIDHFDGQRLKVEGDLRRVGVSAP